jgi:di/tricarboxylate transporter
MNTIRASYLFVVVLSLLAVIATLFFAITASRNAIPFFVFAVLFALNAAIWAYKFLQTSKTSRRSAHSAPVEMIQAQDSRNHKM